MTGTRNPVGLDFHPQTHEPWITVQERDGLGEDLVPDYVARARHGAFFGWPYAYIGAHEDPRHKGARPDLVKATVVPDVILQAHSSVMTLAFYDAAQFPPRYREGAFVALRGSPGAPSGPATRSCSFRSRVEKPPAGTRISSSDGCSAKTCRRCGAARWDSPS